MYQYGEYMTTSCQCITSRQNGQKLQYRQCIGHFTVPRLDLVNLHSVKTVLEVHSVHTGSTSSTCNAGNISR
jgi:hypothetical protein